MNVYIQLTSAGTNTGPFNLYSDVDGFTTPFEQNVSRSKLLQGFTSTLVPTDTTVIKISCLSACNNSFYLYIENQPTTTTTTSTSSTTTSTTSSTTSSTTTTTTSSTSTTTTTSTTGFPKQRILIARNINGTSIANANGSCGESYNNSSVVDINTVQILYFQSNSSTPVDGDILYLDENLTVAFNYGDSTWWSAIVGWDINTINTYNYIIQISNTGEVLDEMPCSSFTTTTTTTTTAILPHITCDDYTITYTKNNPDSLNEWTLSIDLPQAANSHTVFEIEWEATRTDVAETKTFNKFLPVSQGNTTGTISSSDGLYQDAAENWTLNNKEILTITPMGQFTVEACGIYGIHMCVNSGNYDFNNETEIVYNNLPVTINTPTKSGYNYFFLSIPRTKDFSLVDTLGANLRSSMSIDTNSGYNGLDYRDGFQDNYIYKMDDVYATSYSMELILTII